MRSILNSLPKDIKQMSAQDFLKQQAEDSEFD